MNEAVEEEEDFKLVFSDDSKEEYSEEEANKKDEMFVDDASSDEEGEQGASSYRSLSNKEERVKFLNQTRNPEEVAYEYEEEYFGEDDMPELFNPENREEVEFDSFDNNFDKSQTFKNSLLYFSNNVDNQFFYAVAYGLMYCKLNGQNVLLENAREILGDEFLLN